MATTVYAGRSVGTRTEPVVYSCPCGERFRAEVHVAVDAADGQIAAELVEGRLNRATCPSCRMVATIDVAVTYHDGAARRLVLVLPESMRHRELAERARLLQRLAEDVQPPPDYVLGGLEVRFGTRGLGIEPGPFADEEITGPVVLPPDRPGGPDGLAGRGQPIVDKAPALAGPLPDSRAGVTARWIAARESPSAYLADGRVLVLAACSATLQAALIGKPLELRVQLHRMPTYPILALTILGASDEDGPSRNDVERTLVVPLDVARPAHRTVLESLARSFELTVALYDSQYAEIAVEDFKRPLEENVRRLLADAKDVFERLAPTTRSWDRARAALFHASYDRLGRTPVTLPDDAAALDRPSAVLTALAAVTRWSEPSAEAYLLEIRSVPLSKLRAARLLVLDKALEWGISPSRGWAERLAPDLAGKGRSLPAWGEVVAQSMRRFAEVATRTRTNDLSASEEAENWHKLFHEAEQSGVVVEERVRRLAEAAQRRARAGTGGGVDLRAMPTEELVNLLEQKDLRREAALILCERAESSTLDRLFSVVRKLPRAEANLILPSLTAFGAAAERWLLEGLKSKKSYIRQGSALSLGVLATPNAMDGLVELLVSEPTEIWSEVARAIGDLGSSVVPRLGARLREVDSERRTRVIQALAHVAARDADGTSAVAKLTKVRDPVVAAAGERALSMKTEVSALDAAVRADGGSAQPSAEHTVVRGFSRRFYEALRGGAGAIELDADDLEELDLDASEAEEVDDAADSPLADPPIERGRSRPKALLPEEGTSPHPRSSLPGNGR